MPMAFVFSIHCFGVRAKLFKPACILIPSNSTELKSGLLSRSQTPRNSTVLRFLSQLRTRSSERSAFLARAMSVRQMRSSSRCVSMVIAVPCTSIVDFLLLLMNPPPPHLKTSVESVAQSGAGCRAICSGRCLPHLQGLLRHIADQDIHPQFQRTVDLFIAVAGVDRNALAAFAQQLDHRIVKGLYRQAQPAQEKGLDQDTPRLFR